MASPELTNEEKLPISFSTVRPQPISVDRKLTQVHQGLDSPPQSETFATGIPREDSKVRMAASCLRCLNFCLLIDFAKSSHPSAMLRLRLPMLI